MSERYDAEERAWEVSNKNFFRRISFILTPLGCIGFMLRNQHGYLFTVGALMVFLCGGPGLFCGFGWLQWVFSIRKADRERRRRLYDVG